MTTDEDLRSALGGLVPADWEMVSITSLDDVGDWNEILLYRFCSST